VPQDYKTIVKGVADMFPDMPEETIFDICQSAHWDWDTILGFLTSS